MANQKGFFAVDNERFYKACELGLNPAVAYLILCNGTGGCNTSTSWSINAIENYTNIARSRAKKAVELLKQHEVIKQIKTGTRPRYEVKEKHTGRLDPESITWLPSGFVQGVKDEVPPLERIRKGQDVKVLCLCFDLYHEQNLIEDGGLPRYIWQNVYKKEKLADYGFYEIYAFKESKASTSTKGVLKKYGNNVGKKLELLFYMGIVERMPYLFESSADHGEIAHRLNGELGDVTTHAAKEILLKIYGAGFDYDSLEYLAPIPRDQTAAQVIEVLQLRYKPKTKMTAKWYHERAINEAKIIKTYNKIIKDLSPFNAMERYFQSLEHQPIN